MTRTAPEQAWEHFASLLVNPRLYEPTKVAGLKYWGIIEDERYTPSSRVLDVLREWESARGSSGVYLFPLEIVGGVIPTNYVLSPDELVESSIAGLVAGDPFVLTPCDHAWLIEVDDDYGVHFSGPHGLYADLGLDEAHGSASSSD